MGEALRTLCVEAPWYSLKIHWERKQIGPIGSEPLSTGQMASRFVFFFFPPMGIISVCAAKVSVILSSILSLSFFWSHFFFGLVPMASHKLEPGLSKHKQGGQQRV